MCERAQSPLARDVCGERSKKEHPTEKKTMISFAGGTAKTITVLDEQTFSISYTYMVNGVLHHAKESYGH